MTVLDFFWSDVLTFGEGWGRDVILVPEPVPLLQNLKLLTQQAPKGWTHHSAYTEVAIRQESKRASYESNVQKYREGTDR